MKAVIAALAFAAGIAGFSFQASAAPAIAPGAATISKGQGVTDARFRDFRCVARGFTVFGTRIPRTRGVAFGGRRRGACRRAMRVCRAKLRSRKRVGLNPLGQCEVVRVRAVRF
ncbi:MAG: hypothetical protein AAFO62_12540 [Pseudomonadota bacterium]